MRHIRQCRFGIYAQHRKDQLVTFKPERYDFDIGKVSGGHPSEWHQRSSMAPGRLCAAMKKE